MGFSDYDEYDALGLAALVASKEVHPIELLEEAISCSEKVNSKINAVIAEYFDQARQNVSTGLPQGLLTGVPFLLKDVQVRMKGTVASNGSSAWQSDVSQKDSTLVQRYKQAGLVIFGRTNSPEGALRPITEPTFYGPTRNPWNLDRVPGGSSGGAGAAVAAGIVPAAHATDGGGSIRMPASCCGLVGLKPSRGRIPSGPERMEYWGGQSTSHVVTRTVRDSAAFLDLSAGIEMGDAYTAPHQELDFLDAMTRVPRQLRIAVCRSKWGPGDYQPEVIDGVDRTVRILENLGHIVEEASPATDGEAAAEALFTIISVDTAQDLRMRAEVLGQSVDELSIEVGTRMVFEVGSSISGMDYLKAQQTNHDLGRVLGEFHRTYDVILMPTMSKAPVPIGYLSDEHPDSYVERLTSFMGDTGFFNQTGQPSISLPLHWNDEGLPVGMMFSAAYGNDALLLQLAKQLEDEAPWFDKRPLVHASTV